jgi:hypothetical protein
MNETLKLFYELYAVANKGGKGSTGASLRCVVESHTCGAKFVGLMAKKEGAEYFIAIRNPDDTVDLVLINNIPKTKVYVPQLHRSPDNFSEFATTFYRYPIRQPSKLLARMTWREFSRKLPRWQMATRKHCTTT